MEQMTSEKDEEGDDGKGFRKNEGQAADRADLTVTAISLIGCSGGEEEGETVPADAYPREAVELIAPAGPGSGYDLTIRAIAQCLSGAGRWRCLSP